MSTMRDVDLLIFDGACGTNLQRLAIPASAWQGCEGCNELLNVTAPECIEALHRSFYEAGAQVVETNTFGASDIVLAEYGLQDRVEEINTAAVANARRAAGGLPGRFVAGSIGPTTKLVSLGHIERDALAASYRRQMIALVEAGVDALLIETCQDLLQVKTAVVTAFEVLRERGLDLPVLVSVTIEQTGTMLVGTDMAAVCATLEPFPLFSLGLNCATGPEAMASHVRTLSHQWPGRISLMPNQGLPEVVNGQTVYRLTPESFAEHMAAYIVQQGVSVIGGCCGTTPEHIRALADAVRGLRPAARTAAPKPAVASLYQAVEIEQDPRPLLVGERCNANGSRKFRDLLLAEDDEGCLRIALEQEASGAHVLDLCAAYAGRNEKADLVRLVTLFTGRTRLPLVLDSTTPDCLEACLKLYPGRAIVNSINLEDGGKNLDRICRVVKQYGAAVFALTINEKGMAMTADDKLATARAIYERAVGHHGLRPQDLFFDPLTFTIGAGDETLRDAAVQTLEAIRRIKAEWPDVHTLLGLSNISFGLPPPARRLLNSVFLHEAVEAGLDAAIVDAGKIVPLASVAEDDRARCMDLLYDRVRDPEKTPLTLFIEHFSLAREEEEEQVAEGEGLTEEALHRHILKGDKDGVEDLLSILMRRYKPTAIINTLLVPAMRHVGELFGRGEILLPFVLQSAEVMKRAVAYLEPFMDRADEAHGLKILLATVQGDVHDIGKNLVDIILSNNGYTVYNIGIKVPAEKIIAEAQERRVDLIGLSGLLVKSAIVMQESMAQYKEAGLNVPILLGGAALTKKFVAECCAPNYDQPVVYCADAFAGLKAVGDFEAGRLATTTWTAPVEGAGQEEAGEDVEIDRSVPTPKVPFLGRRVVEGLDPSLLFPYLNEQALFRGRWGYRRAKLSAEEYRALIDTEVRPRYEEFKRRSVEDGWVQPKIAYGYYRCWSDDRVLKVEDGDRVFDFPFPRRAAPPRYGIADFFKTREAGGDVAGFFVVTIGARMAKEIQRLYEADAYHDYLLLHGFSVEITDALAEYWHERMRIEMGIGEHRPAEKTGYVVQEYQGSRYGFGYPACPDLDAHLPVFAMLKPEDIGVTLTDSMEMVPEQTTSAIVAHHPQAKYFTV